MPELPEVHTTSTQLNSLIPGKVILSTWSNYESPHYKGKKIIKDNDYLKHFTEKITQTKITSVERRGKNILINLSSEDAILVHLKMTGHLLVGEYEFDKKINEWKAKKEGPLQDPFNQYIRFVITFSDNTHLVMSDMRKFGKITLIESKEDSERELGKLGDEPLEKSFTFYVFNNKLNKKPDWPIKKTIMDQELFVGVGNIYSDEAMWLSKIHPNSITSSLSKDERQDLFRNIKKVLRSGIKFGGDSMQDYRRPDGTPGKFQLKHNVYQRKNESCLDKSCNGEIARIVVAGRSSHFCNSCQKLIT